MLLAFIVLCKYWEKTEADSPKKKFSLSEVGGCPYYFLHQIFKFLSLLRYQIDEAPTFMPKYPLQQYFMQRLHHACLNLSIRL